MFFAVIFIPLTVLPELLLPPYPKGRITFLHCSLLNFTVALNSALRFWRLLAFTFLLLRSVSAPQVKIVPLDEFELLMLFLATQIYMEQKLPLLENGLLKHVSGTTSWNSPLLSNAR
jgi:hypothetical protein